MMLDRTGCLLVAAAILLFVLALYGSLALFGVPV